MCNAPAMVDASLSHLYVCNTGIILWPGLISDSILVVKRLIMVAKY